MNTEKYPWIDDLTSKKAIEAIQSAREQLESTGAAIFPEFLTVQALQKSVEDAKAQEDQAYTTDDYHTAYLKDKDEKKYPKNSIYNHKMRTQVASIAFDELPKDSPLAQLYHDPRLLQFVSLVVQKKTLYLSDDPLGCCSINVFRRNMYHSFHFDESEFSTTLMLQEASDLDTGLFQYTHPLRTNTTPDDLALSKVAAVVAKYDNNNTTTTTFAEIEDDNNNIVVPELQTLDFRPGTLSIFAGSRSLHRVTRVDGNCSRLVAVLTFASTPGFCNSAQVQNMFWGRSSHQQPARPIYSTK